MSQHVRRTITVTITETWTWVWQPDPAATTAEDVQADGRKLSLRRRTVSESMVYELNAPSQEQP